MLATLSHDHDIKHTCNYLFCLDGTLVDPMVPQPVQATVPVQDTPTRPSSSGVVSRHKGKLKGHSHTV